MDIESESTLFEKKKIRTHPFHQSICIYNTFLSKN